MTIIFTLLPLHFSKIKLSGVQNGKSTKTQKTRAHFKNNSKLCGQ